MKKIFWMLGTMFLIPTMSINATVSVDDKAKLTKYEFNPFYQIEPRAKVNINQEIINKKIKPANISKQYNRLSNITPQYKTMAYNTGDRMPKGVVVHATAAGPKDNINNEITYMNRNWRNAFVHAFSDYKEIVEVHNPDYYAWGAGPKANPYYIHIELVETGSTENFIKSVNNQAFYVATKLREYNLTPSRAKKDKTGTVWAHADVSNYLGGTDHGDPFGYFKKYNYSFDEFYNLVVYHYNQIPNPWTIVNNKINYNNGKLKEHYLEKKYKGKLIQKYHRKYDVNGNMTYELKILKYTSGKNITHEERFFSKLTSKKNYVSKSVFRYFDSNSKITRKDERIYTNKQQVSQYASYLYYTNGINKKGTIDTYKRGSNGINYIVRKSVRNKNTKNQFTSRTDYYYNSKAQLKSNKFGNAQRYVYNYKNGKLKQSVRQFYTSKGQLAAKKYYKNYR